ncbi:MAG: hypothetical protein L0215_27000 [Gemmataceae bacterium]|nr:hypothetical protein [Gemmataceae bacterium]
MTKKRLVIIAFWMLVVLSGVILYAGYRSWCPVRHYAAKLKKGMAEKEVVELMGPSEWSMPLGPRALKTWNGKDCQCVVIFDARGAVEIISLSQTEDQRSLWQKFLGLFSR